MAASDHQTAAVRSVPCFVLTVSDTRTADTDRSGPAIVQLVEAAGHRVTGHEIVRDEPADVVRVARREVAARRARAVIATGGTGLAARDSTADALAGLFDKTIAGFGELFRALSFQEIGPAAMLSRATAGIIDGCVVFVLPGSEHAVRLAMTRLILPELGHIVHELDRT